MNAEIVNLRKVRKAKAKANKTVQARENRVLFGRSKAQRVLDADQKSRVARELDGARRTTGEDDGNSGSGDGGQ
jgi:hypothetical protein